jgi:hypothetical protein
MLDPQTLLLLAALAGPHDSPAPAPSANDSTLASVIAPLVPAGQRVRVRTGFGITEGVAGAVAPRGLEMRCEQGGGWSLPCSEPIAWSQIQRIDLSTRRPGHAAKVGAAVGCVIGLATVMSAAAYSGAVSSGPDGGQVMFAGVVGGISGLCLGGFLGGIIDAVVPSWKTVFERR